MEISMESSSRKCNQILFKMKKILVVVVFCIKYYCFSQGKEAPPVFLNSLFVSSTIENGINIYKYTYKDKFIENKTYSIYGYKTSISEIENDALKLKSDLNHGKQTGIINKGAFLNKKKNGLWETFYLNKIVKNEIWNKGIIIANYKVYNTQGDLLYETNFGAEGNGKYKDFYYKTGVLKQEGNYHNGKKEGEWCNYDTKGKLSKTTFYEQGTIVSK